MKTDLHEYFDFLQKPAEVIRLKNSRINLEFIVSLFKEGLSPEQIQNYFVGPLSLEQVYAAVALYVINREEVDDYIRRGDERAEEFRRAHEAAHPESAALRERLAGLKKRFTRPDGTIDFVALRAHVDAEREAGAKELVGAG
jgi:hypothetical protein